jgi:F-type H+-transporting ATPase subunit epsilon
VEKSFQLNIITPDKTVYKGEVSSLIAPGELGYLGVLANHAPLITNLVAGKIIFRESSGKRTVMQSKAKGFLEVLKNNATLLLDNL